MKRKADIELEFSVLKLVTEFYYRRCQVLDVHDGDTIKVRLDLGFNISEVRNLRLAKVWAPELSAPGGVECRAYVKDWIESRIDKKITNDWPFVLQTIKDRETEKYGRYLGTLLHVPSETCLNVDMNEYIISYWKPVDLAR